jgi:hypothetical protein
LLDAEESEVEPPSLGRESYASTQTEVKQAMLVPTFKKTNDFKIKKHATLKIPKINDDETSSQLSAGRYSSKGAKKSASRPIVRNNRLDDKQDPITGYIDLDAASVFGDQK